jgi:hypothetical protein
MCYLYSMAGQFTLDDYYIFFSNISKSAAACSFHQLHSTVELLVLYTDS